jgi:hypothetical protein
MTDGQSKRSQFQFRNRSNNEEKKKKIKQNVILFSVNKTTHPIHFIVIGCSTIYG